MSYVWNIELFDSFDRGKKTCLVRAVLIYSYSEIK